jgi:uncharacterized protein (DUF2236 family)
MLRPMSDIFPPQAEIPALVPGPGSISRRMVGDARVMAGAGYALLLQVAHPTVGAGVTEHSQFKADPWGRLWRTLDYVTMTVYGGAKMAAATGRRLREMHKQIRGVKPDGGHYSALEPEAYAWVHATLALTAVEVIPRFVHPLRRDQVEEFWAEWRRLGRVVGVRERDMPLGYGAFREYCSQMMSERLERTDAVDDLLMTLRGPVPAPPFIGSRTWAALRPLALHELRGPSLWLLGPRLRERFGVRWSRTQELEARAMARASRAATPVLPGSIRNFGPHYMRIRGNAIARTLASSPPSVAERAA